MINNIISLSGSHGVGKTTLFNTLKKYFKDIDRVIFIPEFQTFFKSIGFEINKQNDKLENIIRSIYNGIDYKKDYVYVTDRNQVDIDVYYVYFNNLYKRKYQFTYFNDSEIDYYIIQPNPEYKTDYNDRMDIESAKIINTIFTKKYNRLHNFKFVINNKETENLLIKEIERRLK